MLIYICITGFISFWVINATCKDGEDWQDKYKVKSSKNDLRISALLFGWFLLPYALLLAIFNMFFKRG